VEMNRFDTEKKEWRTLKSNGTNIEPRRNHSADFVGKDLVIFGGIGRRGNFLNDFLTYNISK
jgi:hypothetical protein